MRWPLGRYCDASAHLFGRLHSVLQRGFRQNNGEFLAAVAAGDAPLRRIGANQRRNALKNAVAFLVSAEVVVLLEIVDVHHNQRGPFVLGGDQPPLLLHCVVKIAMVIQLRQAVVAGQICQLVDVLRLQTHVLSQNERKDSVHDGQSEIALENLAVRSRRSIRQIHSNQRSGGDDRNRDAVCRSILQRIGDYHEDEHELVVAFVGAAGEYRAHADAIKNDDFQPLLPCGNSLFALQNQPYGQYKQQKPQRNAQRFQRNLAERLAGRICKEYSKQWVKTEKQGKRLQDTANPVKALLFSFDEFLHVAGDSNPVRSEGNRPSRTGDSGEHPSKKYVLTGSSEIRAPRADRCTTSTRKKQPLPPES